MMREVAREVSGFCVRHSGHWIPEKNPQAFADGLLNFLEGSTAVPERISK
jgi:hypothetical protein